MVDIGESPHRALMRILLVHNFYQQYGGEDDCALAEQALLRDRQETVIFYSRHNNEIKSYSPLGKGLFFPRTIYSRRTTEDLRRLVREHRPQVAYVHNVFPLISPSLYHALQSLGIPCVQVLHDFHLACVNGWFFTRGQICERCKFGNYLHAVRYRCLRGSYALSALYAATLGLHRAAGVWRKIPAYIAMTDFSRQKFVEAGLPEERIFLKPHFIDAGSVEPSYQGGDYVVFLGRLSPEKGIWTLIHGFERLRDMRLKIVGTGPLEQPIRAYVREKQIRNIELTGFQAAEKWSLLKGSLLSVFPSVWYETFGKTILEAYAAGKCVLGSNLGSVPYVIEDGKSGLLFEPGNVGDFVEKVRFLASRPGELERMGRYGRQLAETKYSPGENYGTLRRIFETVLAERTGNGLGGT